LVILESINGGNLTWVSADRKVFFMKEGRIYRTIGMPSNLYSVERPNIEFKEIIEKGSVTYFSYYSFRNSRLDDLKITLKSEVIGKEIVTIFDEKKELVLIEEQISSDLINWKETNKFWVDPVSSFVWVSEQYINPKLPPVLFKVTKKTCYLSRFFF